MNDTIYTLAQTNGSDIYTMLVEDYAIYAPEVSSVPTIAHAGTDFKTSTRTDIPGAVFRMANTPITSSASKYNQRIHQMCFIDSPIILDDMVYKGSDQTIGDLLYLEQQGALQAVYSKIGSQFYYGSQNDGTNGFVGIRAQLNPTGAVYSNGVTVITASAATNTTTAYCTWLNPQGVSFAIGKLGQIEIETPHRQWITTGTLNTTSPAGYSAWKSGVSAWVGLTVASQYSVYGVTGVSYAAPLTDNLAITLKAKIPYIRMSGMTWFMNPTAHTSLQLSRSSIKNQPSLAANGTPAFSPPPEALAGFPLIVTNSILDTENNT